MKSHQVVLLCAALAACGGSSDAPPPPEGTPASAVTSIPEQFAVSIVSPGEGSFQEERDVEVVLRTNVPILPAGDMTPRTGHHHLYLDADLGDLSEPVPTVPGSIIHMGNGAAAYTFENVGSGPHRVIAVVADGAHVPLQPLVVDTVNFVVE